MHTHVNFRKRGMEQIFMKCHGRREGCFTTVSSCAFIMAAGVNQSVDIAAILHLIRFFRKFHKTGSEGKSLKRS